MKLALDFDDFSPLNSNFGILESLKEHYPGFKVSMFTVAWNTQGVSESTPITEAKFKPWVDAVNESDWIEILIHGLLHSPLEYWKLTYIDAKKRTIVASKMFENRNIKFEKIFKAPQWQISSDAEQAVTDLGFLVMHDGYYDWNLNSDQVRCPDGTMKQYLEIPKDQLVIGHGHVQDVCGNGLAQALPMLMKLPTDTEFIFLSEALKERGIYGAK
jgi:hypothetical protein